jgi:hypothetical protein
VRTVTRKECLFGEEQDGIAEMAVEASGEVLGVPDSNAVLARDLE